MNLQSRVKKLEQSAQVDVPAGAKLYNVDGVQVEATITRMPTRYDEGEAMLQSGEVVPIAPTMMLEDVIRRARERVGGEKTAESHTRKELPADILFLRVDGHQGVIERMYRGQKRRRAGGDSDAGS